MHIKPLAIIVYVRSSFCSWWLCTLASLMSWNVLTVTDYDFGLATVLEEHGESFLPYCGINSL